LEEAVEVDVDAIADCQGNVVIGGIMEHIEQAGVHSGDSACRIPPTGIGSQALAKIRETTHQLATALNVVGLMNIQFAVQGETVYLLEANPRASRTVPFVAKATGLPLAAIAARVMAGKSLPELGVNAEPVPEKVSVKEAVLPFDKFLDSDILLGPEMCSTGEAMGIDRDFAGAFAKAELAAYQHLPVSGTVLVLASETAAAEMLPILKEFVALGFDLATVAPAHLSFEALDSQIALFGCVYLSWNAALSAIAEGEIDLLIDVSGYRDAQPMRRQALACRLPVITTVRGAEANAIAIRALQSGQLGVSSCF
jgi:carbamoyl-phosphate synthase large subunit